MTTEELKRALEAYPYARSWIEGLGHKPEDIQHIFADRSLNPTVYIMTANNRRFQKTFVSKECLDMLAQRPEDKPA